MLGIAESGASRRCHPHTKSIRRLVGAVAFVALLSLSFAPGALAALTPSVTIASKTVTYGEDPTAVAQVSGPAGGTTPTGSVQFQLDGVNVGLPVTLDSGGKAPYRPLFPPDVGSRITASYSGDATYAAVSATAPLDIHPAGTTTSLTSSANPATAGGRVDVTATVTNHDTAITPFGSVQFFIDGTPVLDRIPLDDNGQAGVFATGVPVGDFVVSATYHDDTAPIADFTDSQGALTQHVVGRSAPASPPPPPPPPPPPSTSTGPAVAQLALVSGGHAKATAKGRKITVDTGLQAMCPAGGPSCSAEVQASTQSTARRKRTAVTVGGATITIPAGATADIAFVLNRRATKLLRASKRLRIQLATSGQVGNGPPISLKSAVTIALPKSIKLAQRAADPGRRARRPD